MATTPAAQPSPGGQGDALKALDDLAAFCSDDTATVDRHVAVIRAALAARQPVRSSTVSEDMMDVVDRLGSEHDEVDPRAWDHMLIYAPTEKLAARLAARQPVVVDLPESLHDRVEALREVAARQPVGEPVCFISPIDASQLRSKDKTLRWTGTYWDRPGDDAVPVYLGPPAQAVDLDALRRLSDGWLARSEKLSVTQQRKAGAYWACAKELRDWLDSQAVGNG